METAEMLKQVRQELEIMYGQKGLMTREEYVKQVYEIDKEIIKIFNNLDQRRHDHNFNEKNLQDQR